MRLSTSAAQWLRSLVLVLGLILGLHVPAAAAQADLDTLLARAEQGDYNAQCYVGHLYLSGKGVEQDFARARYWYQRVIDQQGADAKIVAHAHLVLGVLFNSGKGGRKCHETARHCFETAASQGYTDAHINLGLMYARGIGVAKDFKQALYWWRLAEEKGHPSAAAYVRQLKKKMNLSG